MTVTQAIIPQLGESIKSRHLYSFAEAFNSRILNGAGDSHWRIPYYIYSTYFIKPRLDDDMLFTPQTEFFDFYQFVNPEDGETWPTSAPQSPQGANLQSNYLNRFIFGMNYQRKDPNSGAWIFEREDVRVQKAQAFLSGGNPHLFSGRTFRFFTSIGTDNGFGKEYTAFGLANEVHSYGYISGNKANNPAGNSYGGFYGLNPLITKADGCGYDSDKIYPLSIGYLLPIDGPEKDAIPVDICNEGTGTTNVPQEYSEVSSGNLNNYFVFTTTDSGVNFTGAAYPKNKWHLSQNQSTVFLGREQKNHIYRLLYNYITYAKGFDFDWFFNNQYAFSPEIGSFVRLKATYDVNTPVLIDRRNLIEDEIQFNEARLALQLTKLSNKRKLNGTFTQSGNEITVIFQGEDNFQNDHNYAVGDIVDLFLYYGNSPISLPRQNFNRFKIAQVPINTVNYSSFIVNLEQIHLDGGAVSGTYSGLVELKMILPVTGGMDYKTIDDNAEIEIYTLNNEAKKEKLTTLTNNSSPAVIDYLYYNDYLMSNSIQAYLYEKRREKDGVLINNHTTYSYTEDYGQIITVPSGFTLYRLEIVPSNIKKCDILISYTTVVPREGQILSFSKYCITSFAVEVNNSARVYLSVPSETVLKSGGSNTGLNDEVCLVRFEIKNLEYFNPSANGNLILYPIFISAYKPKMEDAYALLRACTYYGLKDAHFDNLNHPLKAGKYFSDRLKQSGTLVGGDIRQIPDGTGVHDALNIDLNTNAVYEASRRLSLFTRILGPNNFKRIHNDNTLVFSRFASQSGVIPKLKSTKYLATTSIFSVINQNYTAYPTKAENIFNLNWWKADVPLFGDNFESFYQIDSPTSTVDQEMSYPYYSGYDYYEFKVKENNTLFAKLDNDIVVALGKENVSEPVKLTNIEFACERLFFNYDVFIKGKNNAYIYYQFEDKYGEKYSGVNNQGNIVYKARRFDSKDKSIYTDIELDSEGCVILEKDERISFLGDLDIYYFKRRPKVFPSVFTEIRQTRNFYFIDKNGSFLNTVSNAIWRFNYKAIVSVRNAALDDTIENFKYDDYPAFLLAGSPIFEIPSDEILQDGSTVPGVFNEDVQIYELDLEKLRLLTNTLYSDYDASNVRLNLGTGDIYYDSTTTESFTPFESFTNSQYNKYLAGYKITVSYFKNHDPFSNSIYDLTEASTNPSVEFLAKNTNTNLYEELGSCKFGGEFKLPNINYPFIIEVRVPVNFRRLKNFPYYAANPPVYLSIINCVVATSNPTLLPIIRDGSLIMERSGKLIDPSQDAPLERDIFQGIAPEFDGVASGSLIKNREYIVSGGTILHDGKEYTNGNTFFASIESTFYSVVSGNPIVRPTNGIMETAFPSNFTNEWCLWLNFLPYSPFNSSVFKREVYGDTNSPFIDRCHINSALLPKSAENKHINLGLPKAYAPEAPPSYRYLPLIVPKLKNYAFSNIAVPSVSDGSNENTIGRNLQTNFYRACQGFIKPYKIVKCSYSFENNEHLVYVELDRSIDGSGLKTTSSNPAETFRSDRNGLQDWLDDSKLRFRIGDASITNESGLFQSTSHTSNQYLGSYYPRFFFVKLIPKPFSDGNIKADEYFDSPTNHEMIKQAELYLEAMREGFTAGSTGAIARTGCQNIKGHLTPPDLKYDQLMMNSTKIFIKDQYYFGNRWPSLLPSSFYFNLRDSFSIKNSFTNLFEIFGTSTVKRKEDNPRGFGAIPYVATYLESYVSIAKSINYLVNFRVPYPLNYEETLFTYQLDEPFPTDTYNPGGNSESIFSSTAGPTDLSYIKNLQTGGNIIVNKFQSTYSLRNLDGSLRGSGAGQNYAIGGTLNNTTGEISNPRLIKSYTDTLVKIYGIDTKLKELAYDNVKDILGGIPASFSSYDSSRSATIVIPRNGATYYHIAGPDFFTIGNQYDNSDLVCQLGVSTSIISPPPLLQSPLFYNYKYNQVSNPGNVWRRSAYSTSSVGLNFFDTGFQIIRLETKELVKD